LLNAIAGTVPGLPGRTVGDRGQAHLDALLAERRMTLAELSEKVGVTVVNLSILKNGRAKAIRFSTLTRLCEVLGCQPGDLMSVDPPTTRVR
jgi:putative transcriptional regulator